MENKCNVINLIRLIDDQPADPALEYRLELCGDDPVMPAREKLGLRIELAKRALGKAREVGPQQGLVFGEIEPADRAQSFEQVRDDLLIGRTKGRPLGRWRRGGEPLAFEHQAEEHLGRLRLGHREFVGELPHTERALGDSAPLAVFGDDDRLVQCLGEQGRKVLRALGPPARIARLALLETRVQGRLLVADLIVALPVIRHRTLRRDSR